MIAEDRVGRTTESAQGAPVPEATCCLDERGAKPGEVYASETFQPLCGVGHLVGRVRAELLAALDRELAAEERLAQLEVTGAQFVIIATLMSDARARCASDLCKGISYDAGAMTRMIDRLESKGLLRRERGADDRRLVFLELTDQGRELYPAMREVSRRVQNQFLRGFTPGEARQLEDFLRRVLANA